MKKDIDRRSIFAFALVTILAVCLLLGSGYLTVFGLSVELKGEPPVLFGRAIYPNLNEEGMPLSYSAMIYDVDEEVSKGNAVAYYAEGNRGSCKLSTAYFYGAEGEDYILYNAETEGHFTIDKVDLRGKAVSQMPYIGALLSFCSTLVGTIFSAVIMAAVLALWIAYLAGFIKRMKAPCAEEGEEAAQTAEEPAEEVAEEDATEEVAEETAAEEDATEVAAEETAAEEDATEVAAEETAAEEEVAEEAAEEAAAEEEVAEEPAEELKAEYKGKDDLAYAYVTGSVENITKLEKAVFALNEKKGLGISIEPMAAEPAGTELRCRKDVLPVIAALINKING